MFFLRDHHQDIQKQYKKQRLKQKVFCLGTLLLNNSQNGNTLLQSMAIGLFSISAGGLILMNTNQEQANATLTQQSEQAFNITEAGIANGLNIFTKGNEQYLLLATYDGEGQGWIAPTADDLDFNDDGNYKDDIEINNSNGCGEVNGVTKLKINEDALTFIEELVENTNKNSQQNIADQEIQLGQFGEVGSGSSAGTFAINSYEYDRDNSQGRLIVQGQTNSNQSNQAQYQVTFAVDTKENNSSSMTMADNMNAGALIAGNIDTKAMTVFANTAICSNPAVGNNCGNDMTINSSYCEDGVLRVDRNLDYRGLSRDELNKYSLLETMMSSGNGDFRAPDNKKVTNLVINNLEIPTTAIAPSDANIINLDLATGAMTMSMADSGVQTPTIEMVDEDISIDLSQPPFSNSFMEERIGGALYHSIYIQLKNTANLTGDLNVVIDEKSLENISVNGNKIDSEQIIVRLYINEDITLGENTAIQVFDRNNQRLTGVTEKQRNQMASLRILGGNANGQPVNPLSWNLSNGGCVIGHIHAPTALVSLPQTNGCDRSDQQKAISLNLIAKDEYGARSMNSIASNVENPNVFGAVWAKSIVNNSGANSASFYENPALTKILANEFGDSTPNITGLVNNSTSIQISQGINSIIRQEIE